jgi:methionine-rich copper-binding protein CopC
MAFWATEWTMPSTTTTISTEKELTINKIITQDDANITIEFNQNIIPASVRLRLTKQSSGENIKIDSITGSKLSKTSVDIHLSDILEEESSYAITIISAISEDGVVIKDGAQAIKEFSPTVPLKKSLLTTFNAPPNPNAVTVKETPQKNIGSSNVINQVIPTKNEVKWGNQELPLTWMNPILFVILASITALWVLLFKRVKI